MKILAIDPGLDTGWCVVDSTGVLGCGLGFPSDFHGARHAILERPQVYRAATSKGDPNDLITLAIQLGRYVERLEAKSFRTSLVLPTTWKGQVPKEVHHKRLLRALTPAEAGKVAECIAPISKGKQHNVLDAVALALWARSQKHFT